MVENQELRKWALALAAVYVVIALFFLYDHSAWNAADDMDSRHLYDYQPGVLPFVVAGWIPLLTATSLFFWTTLRSYGASAAIVLSNAGLCTVTIHSQITTAVAWIYNLFGQSTSYFGDAARGHAFPMVEHGLLVWVAIGWGVAGLWMLSSPSQKTRFAWLAAYPLVAGVVFLLASLNPWDDVRWAAATTYAWPFALLALWIQWPARTKASQATRIEPQDAG